MPQQFVFTVFFNGFSPEQQEVSKDFQTKLVAVYVMVQDTYL